MHEGSGRSVNPIPDSSRRPSSGRSPARCTTLSPITPRFSAALIGPSGAVLRAVSPSDRAPPPRVFLNPAPELSRLLQVEVVNHR